MSNTNKLFSLIVLTGLFGGCASAPPQLTTRQFAALVDKVVSQVSELGGATVSSEMQSSGPDPQILVPGPQISGPNPKVVQELVIACGCTPGIKPNRVPIGPPHSLDPAALDRGIKLLASIKTVIALRAQPGSGSTAPLGIVTSAER